MTSAFQLHIQLVAGICALTGHTVSQKAEKNLNLCAYLIKH